jgi:solute:Na+ symporter, SSS family
VRIYGLHPLDSALLVLYVVLVIGIGKYLAGKNKTEDDFFLGGRKMGRWLQFFLNFGNMADPTSAPATAASVYKQGIGGIWLLLITLFLTPYYWFMNVWFRRVRLTTMADLFRERFQSEFLGSCYAVVAIGQAILLIGFGNIIALKTLQPIMIKPEAEYSAADRTMLAEYREYVELHRQREQAPLTPTQSKRYDVVKGLHDQGRIHPYVSYLQPLSFYLLANLLVAVFIVLGGLTATAVINGVQSVLIVLASIVLIPFGLMKIGGFQGLHGRVSAQMFEMFGNSDLSEYTWYSIASFLLVSFIAINAAQGNMNVSGSAKDEMAARMGAVTSGFTKRFLTIAWGFTGLIALALWGVSQSDADQIWGRLTLTLLPVGMIGVMIIAILGGKLANLGSTSVILSALIVKNLYEPLVPGRTERHYMVVARLAVPLILGLGIVVALTMGNAISLLKLTIVMSVAWGAPILLIFLWRRLTKTAVTIQVIVTLILVIILPYAVTAIPSLRCSPQLTIKTHEIVTMVDRKATPADVSSGLAPTLGMTIHKQHRSEPVALYFEDGVAAVDPSDPESPKEGLGRFNVEVYLLHLLGIKVEDFTPPMILTTRLLADAAIPLLLLLVVSLMTPRTESLHLARFYARLKTPVGATPQEEAAEIAHSEADPGRFDHLKLFPRSDWEFTKWDRTDAVGFLACCAFVAFVLVVFEGLLKLGS